MAQVIVVGGGLAGLSAAHTILERGGNVLVLDKQPYGTFTPLLVFQLLPFPLASWVEIPPRPPLVSMGLAPNPSKMLA
jgi:glycine/D-amino acid oxidase-like deaminating enzyme